MQEIINIIDKLKTLSGNAQLDYLKENKNNKTLREVMYYAYNPDLKYNINEAKLDKAFAEVSSLPSENKDGYINLDKDVWEAYKNALTELSVKKGIGNADVARLVKRFLFSMDEKSKELLQGILLKDLRINMGVKLFNKVWHDFYFKYAYMGARPFSDKALSRIVYPCICQTKMDGLFCNSIVDFDNKTVEFISRQGKPIKIKGSLENAYLSLPNRFLTGKYVFTGEILVWDEENDKPFSRKISNGIINRDEKTQEELNAIKQVVWDYIAWDDFVEGVWEKPYSERFAMLQQILQGNDRIKIVDTEYADSKDEVMEIFDRKYASGEEGIVVKNLNQHWVDGKPAGQVKVKSEKDCDLQMVEFLEGKGAYAGMCGSIRCISSDNKLEVFVKPRTFADAEFIWNNQEENLNRILTVKYNDKILSETKKGIYSLYLPVFVEVRTDKDVADKLEDIK